ncbi:MAG: hypothetical protein V3S41_00510, partial [Spirochaetia bacterium]
YATGSTSFLPNLLPGTAIRLPVSEVISILKKRYGSRIDSALSEAATSTAGAAATTAGTAADTPASPSASEPGPAWIRRANVVGINARTVGTFWRVIHYCLTLPRSVNAVHLLPVWEPGVVGSLYGMASWEINEEFTDRELSSLYPHLNTTACQLKAVINLLHVCDRTVGVDVIPHTDRFSQIVLAQPSLFEWLRRDDARIIDHRADLHEEVEDLVYRFLIQAGPAQPNLPKIGVPDRDLFFSDATSEDARSRMLFGSPDDPAGRNARRGALIRFVHAEGYEPVPATMAPPYRGIEVDPSIRTVDSSGDVWLDYRITEPQAMSRVFGPLTRYKLYERMNDNRDWQIDFNHPRVEVWEYVTAHYASIQEQFGFDFMRGDMSHVQMRPDGVPADIPAHYDLLGAVKLRIQRQQPSFAYFAETFLAPPGVMGYGNELDHLEASEADVTLGDLQSVAVAADEFTQRLRRYLDIAKTRGVTPSFTVMTADKDDPRFDSFYLSGNELRLFCALFLPHIPSYTALGFETRDPHPTAAPNEFYSKLYVFQVRSGKYATSGPYRFGANTSLFLRLQRIHRFAEQLLPNLGSDDPVWLLPPDATAGHKVIAWARTSRVFVANCDTVAPAVNVKVPTSAASADASPGDVRCVFSTVPDSTPANPAIARDGFHIPRIDDGECRVYDIPVRTGAG